MNGCLRTRVRKQPLIALCFKFETVLKFFNLEALCAGHKLLSREIFTSVLSCCFCQDDDSSDSEDSSEMEQSYSINLVIVKWMKCCSSVI